MKRGGGVLPWWLDGRLAGAATMHGEGTGSGSEGAQGGNSGFREFRYIDCDLYIN